MEHIWNLMLYASYSYNKSTHEVHNGKEQSQHAHKVLPKGSFIWNVHVLGIRVHLFPKANYLYLTYWYYV